jgi:inhibitor of cysteine peptidase
VAEVIISRSDDQDAFHVTPGDIVELHLPEIPTSGYRWEVRVENGLNLVADTYTTNPASGIGGGGTRVFRIRAVHPGQSRVRAKLGRAWVGETSVVDRCEFLIEVT